MTDRERLIDIINDFDGNSIIETSYDAEPQITERGVERIADSILTQFVSKEEAKKERLDAWKTAHEQYQFDDVMNKELFIPKSKVIELLEGLKCEKTQFLYELNRNDDIDQAIQRLKGEK